MPASNITVSQIHVKIGGTDLNQRQQGLLQQVVVDQSTHLPHMFVLTFRDPAVELIDDAMFDLSKTVEIEAEDADGNRHTLMKGEITALEPSFREGMLLDLVVRGYDKSHRMHREAKSRSHLNTKDSKLAQTIAGEHDLTAQVDDTTTVYDHIFQHNQTDMDFLVQRAWRIGYECFVSDGKLYFRKPPNSGSASVTLTWGRDLTSFHPVMTAAEQVDEVTVRGWDMQAQKAIVGQASKGKLYPAIKDGDGAKKAEPFGTGKKIIVDQPVISQAEADLLAQARLNEVSGAFVRATGIAFRRPDITAGQRVKLENLGNRFNGQYLVTSTVHIYDADGLRSEFEVAGTRTGLLGEQMARRPPLDRWPGAVVAVVTDTQDPEKLGRVKVKYPWMTDDADSFWARVISPGAGSEAGLFMVPQRDDEVVVVFEHGDFDRPYVLGGVWNGKRKIPPPGESAPDGNEYKVRTWHSHTGHQISVYDEAGSDNKIEIITAGGHKLVLDDTDKKIELVSSMGQTLLVDDNASSIDMETTGTVNIKSTGDMTLESTANMKIKAGAMMDISASGPVNVKGTPVNLN